MPSSSRAPITGTTIGTPFSEPTSTLRLRSWLSRYTAAPPSTTTAPIRIASRAAGVPARPRPRRSRLRRNCRAAYPAAQPASSSQPSTGLRLSFAIARTVGSLTEMLVPSFSSISTTPWKPRNAASVTTKDGMPTLATSVPSSSPMAAPVSTAATTAAYQGQPWSVSRIASTAAQTPLA